MHLVAKSTVIPILRKDFIIDEYQILEARAYRADAFLLIANLLEKEKLRDFRVIGEELGMDALVEVHTMEELEKALTKVQIPPKVFIKEPIFEDLKRVFGKDVEVLVNY